jgi:cysteine synthase
MLNKNVLIKDESSNHYGTYKDRRSRFIVKKALSEHISKLCLITSGNAGYSLAKIAKPKGIKVVCVVDKGLKTTIKDRLKKVCFKLIEYDLSKEILQPEQVIALARENEGELVWDVTNGYSEAYGEIVSEIKDRKFEYLVCPVGSGEAFVGLYDGLTKHKIKCTLIGVGVKECPSIADKLATPWTPYKSKISAILKDGHKLIRLTEEEVESAYGANKGKMKCEPSSAVVWAVFDKFNFEPKAKIIIINSGRGLA